MTINALITLFLLASALLTLAAIVRLIPARPRGATPETRSDIIDHQHRRRVLMAYGCFK